MISKATEDSIANTLLKKLRIHQMEYKWDDNGYIIMNYGPTMIYLIFKIINLDTRIGVSNLKGEINKANISKFGKVLKDLLDDMYSNSTIIIDKV